MVASRFRADRSLLNYGHEILECLIDPIDTDGIVGLTLPIRGTKWQIESLKKMVHDGVIIPGSSFLNYKLATLTPDCVQLSVDLNVIEAVEPFVDLSDGTVNHVAGKLDSSLRTAETTVEKTKSYAVSTIGQKKALVVKVKDSVGKTVADSPEVISNALFCTEEDVISLTNNLNICSNDVFTIGPGDITVPSLTTPNADGVIEVDIHLSLEGNSPALIKNAITAAVNTKLGFSLPGPFDHVFYLLEDCYYDCGWGAYSYVNHWLSVYQSEYYKHIGVVMHEIGNNLGLGYSGGLDDVFDSDYTGIMGNPFHHDSGLCYNPAKNWQLGWFDSNKITVNPLNGPVTVELFGTTDASINPKDIPVVLKIETGTWADLFVGFNHGFGDATIEVLDELVVVEAGLNGEAYSQSYLKAHLLNEETYICKDFGGLGLELKITAIDIDLDSTHPYALINIELEGHSLVGINANLENIADAEVDVSLNDGLNTNLDVDVLGDAVEVDANLDIGKEQDVDIDLNIVPVVCNTLTDKLSCRSNGCAWLFGKCC